MPQLLIHSDSGETSYLSIAGETVTIGRRRENTLCLPDLSVSGRHAQIAWQSGCLVIEDLRSTNGTLVNGDRVAVQVLTHLDDIQIGSYRISYSEIDNAVTSAASRDISSIGSANTRSVKPISSAASMADPSSDTTDAFAAIKVASGYKSGSVVKLQKPITTIGKTGGDLGAISKKPTGYYFLPVNDRSGLMTHNGVGMAEQVEVKLVCGDIIEIGGERLEFHFPYFV